MSQATSYPEKTLDAVVPGQIWSVSHTLRMLPGVYLPARMTVIRLDDQRLALHSPVPITNAMAEKLAALGTVAVIIAPNNYHHLYLPKTILRYPEADVWAAPGLATKRPELNLTNFLGPGVRPPFADVLAPVFLAGAPKMDETTFIHRPTKTLVVTDAYFNLLTAPTVASRIMFRLLGTLGKPGQSRIWRSVVVDRKAMAASTRPLLSEAFDRIVMAHGDILESGGKAAFVAATQWLYTD